MLIDRYLIILFLYWIKFQPSLFQEQKCSFDIAILIDVSMPICNGINVTVDCHGVDNYRLQITSFVESFEIGDSGTRFSFITFGDTAKVNWHLNKFNERISLVKAIQNITFMVTNLTSTTDALRLLREEVFIESNGDRPAYNNIAIIYTASNPKPYSEAVFNEEVRKLGLSDISVYVVGMSSRVDMTLMKKLSSLPQLENKNWFFYDQNKIGYVHAIYTLICNKQIPLVNTKANMLIYFGDRLRCEDLDTDVDFYLTFDNPDLTKNIVSMKYNAIGTMLHFIEHDHEYIVSFNLTTSNAKIYKMVSGMKGLALNYEKDLIYVSFAPLFGQSGIFSMTTTGIRRAYIISETNGMPWSLEFSVHSNELYWTDCSPIFPGIYKIKLINGQSKIPIVTTNIKNPTALAIDFKTGNIFWADSSLNYIMKSNIDGTGADSLSISGTDYPVSITLLNEAVYISQGFRRSRILIYNQSTYYLFPSQLILQPLSMVFIQNKIPTSNQITTSYQATTSYQSNTSHQATTSYQKDENSTFTVKDTTMLIIIIVASVVGIIVVIGIIVCICVIIRIRKINLISNSGPIQNNDNVYEQPSYYDTHLSNNAYLEMDKVSK